MADKRFEVLLQAEKSFRELLWSAAQSRSEAPGGQPTFARASVAKSDQTTPNALPTSNGESVQESGRAVNDDGVRYQFLGEQGAAALDAAEEATTRLDNLAVAREMEQAGKDEVNVKSRHPCPASAARVKRAKVTPRVFPLCPQNRPEPAMPDMPIPPKTRHSWEPYPHGHALYCDRKTHQEQVEGSITFVDAANTADPAQDGTFEHPYASIRQAVELAGKNTTIFVREGVYREEVVLRPGQRLTSYLHPNHSSYYTTRTPPVIAPERVGRRYRVKDGEDKGKEYGAVIFMPENSQLSHMTVVASAPDVAAVWVEPAPDCRDSFVALAGNTLHSAGGDALRLNLQSGGRTGKVSLVLNTIVTTPCPANEFRTVAMNVVFAPDESSRTTENGEEEKAADMANESLLLLRNNLHVPEGICMMLDLLGSANEVKLIKNMLSGYQGILLNLDADGNRVAMLRNTVCITGGVGSVHNFNISRTPPPDEVIPDSAPIGLFVEDFSSPDTGGIATLDLRNNHIVATDAFACGIRLREPAGREEHLLDFAQITETNCVRAQGEAAQVFLGSVRREDDGEQVWLAEPGPDFNAK